MPCLALLAALTHVLFPSLAIDQITVALLLLAFTPWLAHYIRSFKVGGVEVLFNELQDQLKSNSDKLERLSRKIDALTYADNSIPDETQKAVNAKVGALQEFLTNVGLPSSSTPARVVGDVDQGLLDYYDPSTGDIHVGIGEGDPGTYERLFIHHQLINVPGYSTVNDARVSVIESAVAWYFLSSFNDQVPSFLDSTGNPVPVDMKTMLVDPNGSVRDFEISAAWTLQLWKIREMLDPPAANAIIARAWLDSMAGTGSLYRRFARSIVNQAAKAHPEVAQHLRSGLSDLGLKIPVPR